MPYPSDLSDEQWALLEPLLPRPGKRGPRHGPDLRLVEDLAALEEFLRAGGAEVYRDQPLDGFDRCYVDDPFGNRIELMEPV